jgi:hypothetical protein
MMMMLVVLVNMMMKKFCTWGIDRRHSEANLGVN